MPNVFISHSSQDKKIAYELCDFLERHNLTCWIAPRNIPAGKNYGNSIMDGIISSGIMLVLFNKNADDSHFVSMEIERGISRKLTILPIMLQNYQPQNLELFLSSLQWIEAYNGAPNKYFPSILTACNAILNNKEDSHVIINKGKGKAPLLLYNKLAFIVVFLLLLIFSFAYYKNIQKTNNSNSLKLNSSILPSKNSSNETLRLINNSKETLNKKPITNVANHKPIHFNSSSRITTEKTLSKDFSQQMDIPSEPIEKKSEINKLNTIAPRYENNAEHHEIEITNAGSNKYIIQGVLGGNTPIQAMASMKNNYLTLKGDNKINGSIQVNQSSITIDIVVQGNLTKKFFGTLRIAD